MNRFFVLLVLMTLVYIVMVASFTVWDVLAGVVLSATLLLAFRHLLLPSSPGSAPGFLHRLLALVPFLAAAVVEIARSTWDVFLTSIRIRPLKEAGIVAIPMGPRTRLGVVVTAFLLTLSPGSLLVDLDWEQRQMYFHSLDATHPDSLRQRYQDFYETYQQHVFP
jgi:multisubunit Na+/H+ antiporter MnhE subunit